MEPEKVKGQRMGRIGIDAADPIFGAGSAHTYTAPITVSPSGIACEAELYLGPDEATKSATSGLIAFTSTGLAKSISFPITMPPGVGVAYHGYIDVYADGYFIGGYVLIEDVVIPSVIVGPGTWE